MIILSDEYTTQPISGCVALLLDWNFIKAMAVEGVEPQRGQAESAN
jgi:hypothetical protein